MNGDADLLLAGGGLANGLIAWRLRQAQPHLRVLLLEAGPRLGGNHTWSFHDGDLSAAQHAWIAPLVSHRWTSHTVRFPSGARQLAGGYASIASQQFHDVLAAELGASVRLGADVVTVGPRQVTLADGTVLRASAVIDARGTPPAGAIRLGFQKFIGQEWRLARPHGLAGPVLMDATVAQRDGYRFVYTLPLDPTRVLVEDTFYADGGHLDAQRIRIDLHSYMRAQGWEPAQLLREEQGVLPIVLDGDPQALWDAAGGVPRAGLAAALFHPTTGYSLPDAARLADLLAAHTDWTSAAVFARVRHHALAQWRAQGFFRLLNRMLFEAAVPTQRWRVMQRFYGLPEPLVARFYAGRPTLADKLRILTGKPPVAVGPALRAALGRGMPLGSLP